MKFKKILSLLLTLILTSSISEAHCQIPCGIYEDEIKFSKLDEHIETIAKSSDQIRQISSNKPLEPQNLQQIIRWTTNKETHAQKVIDEVANYFLAQRIKPDSGHYEKKLELLHQIILLSMKSKQNVESDSVKVLAYKLSQFKEIYMRHN